jgi:hypothetical protein
MKPRRGRPRLDPTDPTVEMCLALPAKRYDDLYARAQAARVSVPEFVRRIISIGKIPPREPSR